MGGRVLIVETAYYKNREGRLVDTGDKEVGFVSFQPLPVRILIAS